MPKYVISEPQPGSISGSIVQPCPTTGVIAVTLDYRTKDVPIQKAVTIQICDPTGTVCLSKVWTEIILITHRTATVGLYTVKVISDQWHAPINTVYQGRVQLGQSTSVHIPLATETPIVPKLIHFVWAGGQRLMPPDNIDTVKEWAKRHQSEGFKVWIWIDEKTTPGTRTRYADFGLPSNAPAIELPDITEHGVSSPHVRYEIDRLRPNYGSSSDMLRYNILAKFGGAYFDSDVKPGDMTLNHDKMFDRAKPGLLLLDNNSQGKGLIGNDTFICTPGNSLMLAIACAAEGNYKRPYPETGSRVYSYDNVTHKANITIFKTGPMAVSEVMLKENKLRDKPRTIDALNRKIQVTTKALDGQMFLNQALDEFWIDNRYVKPEDQNHGNWLKPYIKKIDTVSEAITIVINTIKFESKYMNLLRLDDHVRDIAEATGQKFTETGEPFEHEHDIASQLVRHLKAVSMDLASGLTGQVMSRYWPLRKLCYQKNLIGIQDGRTIQATRPLGMETGPRGVPGTLAMFNEKVQGMKAVNAVQMGIHFLENGLSRSGHQMLSFKTSYPLRAVNNLRFSTAFEEEKALIEALAMLLASLSKIFYDNQSAFNHDMSDKMTEKEYTAHLLFKLEGFISGLKKHLAYDLNAPNPPLDPNWLTSVGSSKLYGV